MLGKIYGDTKDIAAISIAESDNLYNTLLCESECMYRPFVCIYYSIKIMIVEYYKIISISTIRASTDFMPL